MKDDHYVITLLRIVLLDLCRSLASNMFLLVLGGVLGDRVGRGWDE